MIDQSYNILVVEDENAFRKLVQKELERSGFQIESVKSGKDAVKWAKKNQNSLLLLDYKLSDISAQQVITQLQKAKINAYFIIMTGHADIKIAIEMMKLGVKDYLIKDSNFLELLPTAVNRAISEFEKEKRLNKAEEALRKSEESYRLLAESVMDVIWITDIDLRIIYVSQSITRLLGYTPEELINTKFQKLLTSESAKEINNFYNRILRNLKSGETDILKNGMLELEQLKKDSSPVWTEIRASFMFDSQNQFCGLLGVTRDITGRKLAEAELNRSCMNLHKALEASVQAMGKATEIRDPYTAGHQKRVSMLAYAIAKEIKLSDEECEGVRLAGGIHDIGKIYVPAEILSKPGILSGNEINIIKTHSQVGFDILKTIDFPWPIAKIVLQHHERIDGSGYPLGITGEEILIEAKIIAVADVVEAMASHRPYRPSLGIENAIEEIKKHKNILYDSTIVDICIELITQKGFTFE